MTDSERFQKIKRKPLSNIDIEKFFSNDINLIDCNSEELKEVENIDELLGGKPYCILFYRNIGLSIGHWCSLVLFNDKLEFFNPSGGFIDKMVKDKQDKIISKLMKFSKYKLYYNETKYQRDFTMTCGRHCVIRCVSYKFDEKKYKEFMDSMLKKFNLTDYDDLVTCLTFNF